MKLSEVNHLTESQGRAWSKMLDQAKSLAGLEETIVNDWRGLCDDVADIVEKWTAKDFEDFKAMLKLERRGVFTGEENARKYCVVLMPELMFKAEMVAEQMKVPWGLAVIRLVEIAK